MKQADLLKYHHLDLTQLVSEVKKQESVLIGNRLDKVTGKLKNLHLPSTNRHDLARLKTLVRLKQLTNIPTTNKKSAPATPIRLKAKTTSKRTSKSTETTL